MQIKAEAETIEAGLGAALEAGVPASDVRAMDLARAHRQHISTWFYDCPPPLHRGLGDLYVSDPLFGAHYDERVAGLAQYVRDAIHADADRTA